MSRLHPRPASCSAHSLAGSCAGSGRSHACSWGGVDLVVVPSRLSSMSRTNRAPVIDSITPRLASQALGDVTRPVGVRRCRGVLDTLAGIVNQATSSRRRLRSNPAYNIRTGLLVLAPEPVTEEALFHRSPKRRSRVVGAGRVCTAPGLRRRRGGPWPLGAAGLARDRGLLGRGGVVLAADAG